MHEIPVGPVHAGTIEPGHFRFSIVGEKVLRLEERLGYKHKGIEKRFEAMTLGRGREARRARVAAIAPSPTPGPMPWRSRASAGTEPPRARARAARAPARARAHRQPPGRPRLSRQRRRALLRLLPVLAPEGGPAAAERRAVRPPLPDGPHRSRRRRVRSAARPGAAPASTGWSGSSPRSRRCKAIYDDHAGAQDRFIMTGQVLPELAEKLGLTGLRRTRERRHARPARRFPDPALRAAGGAHGHAHARRRRRARLGALRGNVRVAAPGPGAGPASSPPGEIRVAVAVPRRPARAASAGSRAGAAKC